MVDAVLDVSVHEGGEIVDGVVDAVVRDASLRIVVGAYLGGAVASADHRLTLGGDVVNVLLVFLIVDEGTQAREGAFLVLGLVARLGTFDEDFFDYACVGILPVVAQAHAGFHLVHVLTAGTTASEGVPLDFTFVDNYVELFGFGKHGYAGG